MSKRDYYEILGVEKGVDEKNNDPGQGSRTEN